MEQSNKIPGDFIPLVSPLVSPLISPLIYMIRECSLTRLKKQVKLENLTLVNTDPRLLIFGHWLSTILIFNESIKIIFKAHFISSEVEPFVNMIYKGTDKKIGASQIADFVREFCNLTAGNVKAILAQNKLDTGIGLPLVTRGFDEIFYPCANNNTSFSDIWRIEYDKDCSIVCSVFIEILDNCVRETIAAANFNTSKPMGGEIDFL